MIAELANSGLTVLDNQGRLAPRLAEATPSIDNGLWRVNADGSAETTWKLRAGAQWHDGTRFTSADLAFTLVVLQDRSLAWLTAARDPAFDFIASVDTPDSETIRLTWKEPYIQADQMFTRTLASPLPFHLLETPYQQDRGSFLGLPYWSDAYVGTGPFKLKEWALGSSMTFSANDAYVLGRPRLDEVEIRFVPDPNTIFANALAGSVDLTLGKTVSIEQALEAEKRWSAGRIDSAPGNAVVVRIQFLYTNPPIVLQLPFRKALEHAIDRQQMVETLTGGLAPAATTSLFSPREAPDYAPAREQVVRYPYEPRRSQQLIEGLGYARGGDDLYRDARGQSISVGIRTNVEDLNQKATFAVADFWRQVGVESVPEIFPQSAATDQEYRAKFPSFELLRGMDLGSVKDFRTSQRKTAQNNWRGLNGGYGSPDYDALVDRYLVTIPTGARVDLLGDVLRHVSDQVVVMVLFWDVEPILLGRRVQNVSARHRSSSHGWNAYLWDVAA